MHTFIITKTQTCPDQPTTSSLNNKFTNEVHIGLLSSRFIKDSDSEHLIAPIISFEVVKATNKAGGRYELVPKTPLSEKFINLILSYIGIF